MKLIRVSQAPGSGHVIDRKIFGSFIEHAENCIQGGILDPGNPLSDGKGIRQDVLTLCRELGPTLLRFPGGTVVGTYHWEDYVGPVVQRKIRRNLVWGGMMAEGFGTCEYISWCRQIGAEPMICVNMPSGTPEEASHWVEYCNGEGNSCYAALRKNHGYAEPFHVRYWCIGNESFSKQDLGLQDDVREYVRQAWEYARYMKMADPEIELIFVGNACDMDWNREVMASLWEICDYLSIHFYARSGEEVQQLRAFEERMGELRSLLAGYNARPLRMDRWYRIPARQHDIRIALDEWNIWDGEPDERSAYGLQQRYTWGDALWTAAFLNLMIRNGDLVRIGNLAQLVNVLAPVVAEEHRVWKQTIFTPFALYAARCGAAYLPCEGERQGQLDAVLTGEAGGEKKLFAVNREKEGLVLETPGEIQWIRSWTADHLLDQNSGETDCVRCRERKGQAENRAELPPESLNLILLRDGTAQDGKE